MAAERSNGAGVLRGAKVKESAFYWWRRTLARDRVRRPSPRAGQPAAEENDPAENPPGPICREAARFLPVHVVMDQAGEPHRGVEIHSGQRSGGAAVSRVRSADAGSRWLGP